VVVDKRPDSVDNRVPMWKRRFRTTDAQVSSGGRLGMILAPHGTWPGIDPRFIDRARPVARRVIHQPRPVVHADRTFG
jgi:hypothetical protein